MFATSDMLALRQASRRLTSPPASSESSSVSRSALIGVRQSLEQPPSLLPARRWPSTPSMTPATSQRSTSNWHESVRNSLKFRANFRFEHTWGRWEAAAQKCVFEFSPMSKRVCARGRVFASLAPSAGKELQHRNSQWVFSEAALELLRPAMQLSTGLCLE